MSMAVYEEVREVIDHETGEVKTTTRLQKARRDDEPYYIKLYIADLCKLNDIPKSGNNTLNELLKLTDYQNEIVLNSHIKGRIRKKLGISIGSLDNNITRLVKQEVLQRIGRGTLKLNPNLFGKGNWTDIKKLRIEWEYSENGRDVIGLETDDFIQTEMDFKEAEKEIYSEVA
jgi:hypothetical protein